jgi:hypothetical protein
MSYITAWFSLVPEPLGLISAGLGYREDSSVRLGYREPDAILETPRTEVPSGRDIVSRPNYVWIKGQNAMRPTLVPSNRSLKNELVDLEEKAFVFGIRVRWLRPVGSGQNHVPNSD